MKDMFWGSLAWIVQLLCIAAVITTYYGMFGGTCFGEPCFRLQWFRTGIIVVGCVISGIALLALARIGTKRRHRVDKKDEIACPMAGMEEDMPR